MQQLQKWLTVLFLLNLAHSVFSQVVNIEDKRQRLRDTVDWLGSLDISGSWVKNDKSLMTLRGNLQTEYGRPGQFWLAISQFNLVKAGDQNFLNDGFQHVRYNRDIKPWLVWEAFGQAQYNERARLLFRGLTGTGLRFKLRPILKQRVYFGMLAMWEYNQLRDTSLIYREPRMSHYLSFNVNLSEKGRLVSTTYWQPLFSDIQNFRLSSESSLLLPIAKGLQFKSTLTYFYDSDPRLPPAVPNRLSSFLAGLRYEW